MSVLKTLGISRNKFKAEWCEILIKNIKWARFGAGSWVCHDRGAATIGTWTTLSVVTGLHSQHFFKHRRGPLRYGLHWSSKRRRRRLRWTEWSRTKFASWSVYHISFILWGYSAADHCFALHCDLNTLIRDVVEHVLKISTFCLLIFSSGFIPQLLNILQNSFRTHMLSYFLLVTFLG